MNDKLKSIIENGVEWSIDLVESDFFHTVSMSEDIIALRKEWFEKKFKECYTRESDTADEIIADISHYRYLEDQFIWQFCLWRLQAIFEGMIINNFLPEKPKKPLFGLKAKLDELLKAKYVINEKDQKELLDWAIIRNILSHDPHGHFSLSPIEKSDIIEYKDFLLRITINLNNQKIKLTTV